jgi:hypothetical protein
MNNIETMYCTISYWILGEHGDKQRVSDGGVNLTKTWYIERDLKYQGKIPLDYQHTLNKKKKEQEVKQVFFRGMYQWEWRWA